MRFAIVVLVLGLLAIPGVVVAQTAPTAGRTGNAFAITLLSSFDPIPETSVPGDNKGLTLYRTQENVFGRSIHFLRIGFFKSADEAEKWRSRLLPQFPSAFLTTVLPEEVTRVTGSKPAIAPPSTAPPAAAAAPAPASKPKAPERFALTLTESRTGKPFPKQPLPPELANKRLYFRSGGRTGKPVITLNLGFFNNLAEAEKALGLMRADYPAATIHGVSRQEQERSDLQTTAYVPPKPVPAAAPPAPSLAIIAPPDVAQAADELMGKARAAITDGKNAVALSTLNQILKLPPNKQSRDAQELVGLVHERNGEIQAARQEYTLYLKLYPEGDGAERVRQRLANLAAPEQAPRLTAARKKESNVTTAYGSFSQYYYHGNTKLDTTMLVGPILNTATLTTTDQSALISSLDLTGRMRSGDWDNRIVIRDTYTSNFLEGAEDRNRLYSAYADVRNRASDFGGRLGRQTGSTGGLPARFDGLNAGYGFLPKWRLNIAAGKPVEFNPIDSDKQFWGTSLDFGTFAEHWNGNLFYVQQTVDGINDRQATGLELRYFKPSRSLLLLTDYDLSYNELNIAMFQGSWTWNNKTTLNVLADHRRAPILQTSNAVIGEPNTSIEGQLLVLTEAQLRQQALDKTPTANLLMLGVTHNFSKKWQLGGDVKLYNISSTPASGSLPASPGTGNVLVYTLQGIASSVFSKRDITVLSLSYLTSDNYDGFSAGLNNRTLFLDSWTLDASLRYYTQQDTAGVDLQRITPMLRLGYRWRQSLTFEVEYGLEKTKTESATTLDETTAQFFMVGYRWDF